MKIVFASSNKGKLQEMALAFSESEVELIPQTDLSIEDAEETGLTFIENAILKARHASRMSGLPALADDSGLCVTALSGAPGIYSARYSGAGATSADNIVKLLADLEEENLRSAYFYCILVFVSHWQDPTPIVTEGIWHGEILSALQGTAGFGYDPIFYVPSLQKTAAELSTETKNSLSHRGQAIQALKAKLNSTFLKR